VPILADLGVFHFIKTHQSVLIRQAGGSDSLGLVIEFGPIWIKDVKGGAAASRTGVLNHSGLSDGSVLQSSRKQQVERSSVSGPRSAGDQFPASLRRRAIRIQSQDQLLQIHSRRLSAIRLRAHENVSASADLISVGNGLHVDLHAVDEQGDPVISHCQRDFVETVVEQLTDAVENNASRPAGFVLKKVLDGAVSAVEPDSHFRFAGSALVSDQIPAVAQRPPVHSQSADDGKLVRHPAAEHIFGSDPQIASLLNAVGRNSSVRSGDLDGGTDAGDASRRKVEGREKVVLFLESAAAEQILAVVGFGFARILVKPQRLDIDGDGSRGSVLLRRQDVAGNVDGTVGRNSLGLDGSAVHVERHLVLGGGDVDLVEIAVENAVHVIFKNGGLEGAALIFEKDGDGSIGAVEVDAELRSAVAALDADQVPTLRPHVGPLKAEDALESEAVGRKSAGERI